MDALIFIDTNIFLDFYRLRNETSLKYLEEINKHKNLLIFTRQVEMEFKKNRQKVLLDSIQNLKKKPEVLQDFPSLLKDEKSVLKIRELKKEIENEQKVLIDQILNIFKNPEEFDEVYKLLNKLFANLGDLYLSGNNSFYNKIDKVAKQRFERGFPPRKKDDTSYGDAINWEWILHCASTNKKDVIIVSRDSDYGIISEKESYVNDWLNHEFKGRVGKSRTITLTASLGSAFKMVNIPVSEEMISDEVEIVRNDLVQFNYQEMVRRIRLAYPEVSPIQKAYQEIASNYDGSKMIDAMKKSSEQIERITNPLKTLNLSGIDKLYKDDQEN